MKCKPSWLLQRTHLVWVIAILAACHVQSPRTAADLEPLQGYWEGRGPGGECSITISGDSLYFRAREDFWYDTSFTVLADKDPKQLHATILRDSSKEQKHIGNVVVAIFKIEDGELTLGVMGDYEGPPSEPVVGDWDWAMDIYVLHRAQPPTDLTGG